MSASSQWIALATMSETYVETVTLDLLAPTAELTDRAYLADPPSVQTNVALELNGVANDGGRNPAPSTPSELAGTLDSLGDATTLFELTSLSDDDNGVALAWLGDVNGDRLADLAVGLPSAENGAGTVTILRGRGGDWPIPRLGESDYLAQANSIFKGQAGAGVGSVIAPAGDINGDGLSEFLIGDETNSRVYLIRGRVGIYGNDNELDGSDGYERLELLPPDGMTIGGAVAPAGDVNNDGRDDFLIRASSATTSSVYLVLGDVKSLDPVAVDQLAAAAFHTTSPDATIGTVGDINSDAMDEFAIGYGGQVHVYRGSNVYVNGSALDYETGSADFSFVSADAHPTFVRLHDLGNNGGSDFGYTSGTTPQIVFGDENETFTVQSLDFTPAASGALAAGGDVNRNGHPDILVINASADLYVIDGSDIGTIVATVANVHSVASAPYARGADLNADDADDIAVMPSAGASVRSTTHNVTVIDPNWLPQADPVLRQVEAATLSRATAAVRYVDDDYCASCYNGAGTWGVNAYDTLQSAIDAANAGDTIIVQPGTYAPITIDTDELTIRGVNPDAVFIDGSGANEAIVINGADGVRLEKLTIRNADTLLKLNDAGQFGWFDDDDQITLSRVLLQDYAAHAVWMTDDSTIHASDTTIVGSGDHIEVLNDGSDTDPVATAVISDTRVSSGAAGGIATNDYLMFFPVDDDEGDTLYEYEIEAGTWHSRGFAAGSGGIVTGTVYASQEQSEGLQKNSFYVLRPAGEGHNASINRLNSGEGVWAHLDLGGWSDEFSDGLAAAFGRIYQLYILSGDANNRFYRFDALPNGTLTTNRFEQLASPPSVGTGSALLVYGNGLEGVYALLGGGSQSLCKWSSDSFDNNGSWDCSLAQIPIAPGAGAALASDGGHYWENTGYFYATVGGGSNKWYRYSIADDSWTAMPDLPIAIHAGGGMVRDAGTTTRPGDYLYFTGGETGELWRYGRELANGFTKVTLDDVAIVTGSEANSAEWLNQSEQASTFAIELDNLALVGGNSTTWTPNVGTTYTNADTAFSDVAHGIYRLSGFGLSAGYHDYALPATVTTQNLSVNQRRYASIQDAIDSGANDITIEAGAYAESFYMLSGVTLAGAGAELTSITMPAGDSATSLIKMEGVRGATLANLRLSGTRFYTGIEADGQVQDSLLTRSIVEGFLYGVYLSDLNSELEMVNNTLISNNVAGIWTENCGSVNARNNVIAYTGLSGIFANDCAATMLHTYNLYWANGNDLTNSDPGSAELFLDPLYNNVAYGDYSTAEFSPVIDGGDPADPTPPGAGGRVDIGHLEQSGTTAYVDDGYCESCTNDGLLWGVTAFATIQSAINAVEAIQTSLTTGEVVPFTIGVAPGVYDEVVTIRSPITLLGSGADQTILRPSANAGVRFIGATQAGITGFQIDGADAGNFAIGVHVTDGANNITIERNLILRWTRLGEAIVFDGRGSGVVQFNTIVNNDMGIQAIDDWAIVDATNNIFNGNDASFEALGTPIGGIINSDFNLSRNSSGTHYWHTDQGDNDIVDVDPLFAETVNYTLQAASPAADSADPKADVPLGGGLLADIGWHEVTDQSIAMAILMGEIDASRVTASEGVQQVEYAVVPVADNSSPITSTLPVTWSLATLARPDNELTTWSASHTPTAEGVYRIYSRATDVHGNVEDDPSDWYDGTFVADDIDPVVTWLSPAGGSDFATGFVTLQAQVADYIGSEFDVASVAFEINGSTYSAEWSSESWTADGSTPRKFLLYTNVFSTGLPVGSYSAKALVTDGAGNSAETSPISFTVSAIGIADTTPPTLTVTSHADGDIVSDYIAQIAGTGSDADSGIQTYAVSIDGGVTWQDATNTGSGFTFDWALGAEQGTTYPVQVRAIDWAGNITVVALSLSVDTVAPSDMSPFTFSVPVGSHTDGPFDLDVTWTDPTDNSGTTQVFVKRGHTVEAVSGNFFQLVDDNSYSYWMYPTFEDEVYIGIKAEDLSGNDRLYTFGPWYIGNLVQVHGWQAGSQTIIYDGFIDIANSEWLTETELLDSDQSTTFGPQTLYATWGGRTANLAWEGVHWETGGTLWAYYDVHDGVGTTQPISLTGLLPFSADYAISFDGTTQMNWTFNGSTWSGVAAEYWDDDSRAAVNSPVPPHPADSVEMSFNFDGQNTLNYDHHRMVAFGVNDADEVWASFPLLNDHDTTPEHYFEWMNPTSDLLFLPDGARVPQAELTIDSIPGAQTWLGDSTTVSYIANATNIGYETISGAQLVFTGTTGMSYSAVAGGTCVSCAGSNWVVTLPDVALGASVMVTLTGATSADMSAINHVTTTVTLSQTATVATATQVSHAIDHVVPTGSFDQTPGSVINATERVVSGSADDSGSGVALVEVSTDGTNWAAASGTTAWSAALPNSRAVGSTINVQVRITDHLGNDVTLSQDVVPDDTAPTTTVNIPDFVGGGRAVTGVASDPAPTDAQVETVEIQLDDANSVWQVLGLDAANPDGSRDWLFNNFGTGDGEIRPMRLRATDYAGNITVTEWYSPVVDTIAPTLVITEHRQAVQVGDSAPVLIGTLADGGGFGNLQAVATDLISGTEIVLTPTVNNGRAVSIGWSVDVTSLPIGEYSLELVASDLAGNVQTVGGFDVEVTETIPTAVGLSDVSAETNQGYGASLDRDVANPGELARLNGLLHVVSALLALTVLLFTVRRRKK